jgi:NitT/TauT family transport system substrate-binding protein
MLDAMLEGKGLPRDFVERVDIKQISVRLQLLLAGKVDAAVLPEPLLSLVEVKGAKVILDNTVFGGPLAITSLRRDAVEAMGAAQVAAFQTALGEAMRRVTADPDSYRQKMIALRLLPKAASPRYTMIRYEAENTPLPLPTTAELEKIARWMLGVGLLKAMPKVEEILPANP